MSFRTTRLWWLGTAVLAGCTSQPDAATHAPTAQTPSATHPASPQALATTRYAGEYRWREADNEEMGGILTVYPESDSTILFQVDANDGAPAYHIASAFGRARLRGDTAVYFGKAPEDEHGCKLKIGFAPTGAKVMLVSGQENDCFFGGNFTPEGTYQRTSRAVPREVILNDGDTVRFAHVPADLLKDSH